MHLRPEQQERIGGDRMDSFRIESVSPPLKVYPLPQRAVHFRNSLLSVCRTKRIQKIIGKTMANPAADN